MKTDRRMEVVDACLNLFVKKGLYQTSTRDLSKAIKLQSGGLYYYFQTKDQAVLACVERAIRTLEETLILPVTQELNSPACIIRNTLLRADKVAPVYQFVVTVCSDKKYQENTKPILDELGKRYQYYSEQLAAQLNCQTQDIAPYVYMCITAITNYMVFKELSFVAPQLQVVQNKLDDLFAKMQKSNKTT